MINSQAVPLVCPLALTEEVGGWVVGTVFSVFCGPSVLLSTVGLQSHVPTGRNPVLPGSHPRYPLVYHRYRPLGLPPIALEPLTECGPQHPARLPLCLF